MNQVKDPRDEIHAGRSLGLRKSEWFDNWFISWSPRNSNQNAEGEWAEWVDLARKILQADEMASSLNVSETED